MNANTPVPSEKTPVKVTSGPFGRLQREVERLFDDFSRGFATFTSTAVMPSMDVSETDKEIELTVELPGLEEKDVEINVADNVLTVRGEKKAEKEQKDKNYRLIERSYGAFARSIQLPAGADADKIKATIAKGILKVSVPKNAANTKKIEVKAA